MPKTRISLALPTIPREPNTNKDAEVKNVYIDNSKTGVSYAVKRPGFYVGLEGITTGTNKGVFWNPNSNNPGIFIINSLGELDFYPYLGNGNFGFMWASGTSYILGDGPIFYEEEEGGELTGPWYSTIPNNINNPPSSTSPYWSLSPITTLYYGVYSGGNGPTCGSVGAAGITAYTAFETLNSCENRNPDSGVWREYVGVGGVGGNQILVQQWTAFKPPGESLNCTAVNGGIASFGTVVQL